MAWSQSPCPVLIELGIPFPLGGGAVNQEAMGSVLALDYVLDRAAEEPSQTAGLDLKP